MFPVRGFPRVTGTPWLSIHSEERSSKKWIKLSESVIVVQSLSCVQLFATQGLQHARPPCPSPSPGAPHVLNQSVAGLTEG